MRIKMDISILIQNCKIISTRNAIIQKKNEMKSNLFSDIYYQLYIIYYEHVKNFL